MIQEVLAGGYAEYLRTAFPEEERREDDLRQLAEFAGRFEDLPRLLSEIALVAEFSARESTGEASDESLTPISAVLRAGERASLRLSRFIEELPVGEETPYVRLILETRTAQDGS